MPGSGRVAGKNSRDPRGPVASRIDYQRGTPSGTAGVRAARADPGDLGRSSMNIRRIVITVAAALALVAGGSAAGAAIAAGPVGSDGTIHGCWTNAAINGTHAFVLQDANSSCPKGTTAISWNDGHRPPGRRRLPAAGPQGAKGDTGAQGPHGNDGAPGPAGPAGADGNTVLHGTGGAGTPPAAMVTSTSTPLPACCTGPKRAAPGPRRVPGLTGPAAWRGPAGPAGFRRQPGLDERIAMRPGHRVRGHAERRLRAPAGRHG